MDPDDDSARVEPPWRAARVRENVTLNVVGRIARAGEELEGAS
jgi:hypothetical protein